MVLVFFDDAQGAGCIEIGEEGEVAPTPAGRIASIYYLQVLHESPVCQLTSQQPEPNLTKGTTWPSCRCSRALCNACAAIAHVALFNPAAHDDGLLCTAPGLRHGLEGAPQ
jgi:hypothetical protein